ncbi:hypothetical protein NDN08_007489 [Rhodosorus marinus]|uniref:Reverse transcriptase Ty1/copia-type domain-containing protein n=1 Tax=Rhodosorus marinus TaxID=101924 RepID=A0AAV8V3G6_9RHOD|nr:hypothetical protein NDN08_007489 [Rhodosorus marinus]
MLPSKPEQQPLVQPTMDAHNYPWALIGSLSFVAHRTRPDILSAVRALAMRMHIPTRADWVAARRILRYLKGTLDLGLEFCLSRKQNLALYTDASWGTGATRRSTTGFAIFVGNCLLTYASRSQRTVATSAAVAKLVAVADRLRNLRWMNQLLTEVGLQTTSTTVYNDNQSCLKWINGSGNALQKHVDIAYRYVQEQEDMRNYTFAYVPTEEQVADIFTKAISSPALIRHRGILESNTYAHYCWDEGEC